MCLLFHYIPEKKNSKGFLLLRNLKSKHFKIFCSNKIENFNRHFEKTKIFSKAPVSYYIPKKII